MSPAHQPVLFAVVLIAAFPFQANAYPDLFSCDAKCMMEKAPGQTFGKMSLSTFEADVSKAKGDACYLQLETITGTKVNEYEEGVKYKVAIYSAATKAFRLAASSGKIAKTYDRNKAKATKQDWTGVAVASTNFIALCGDTGGVFVSNKHSVAKKEHFCDRYQKTCTKVTGDSWSNCKSDFAALAKGSGQAAEDTQACREYHLGLASTDASTHCPHASKGGGGMCVKKETTTPPATKSCFSKDGVTFDSKVTADKKSVVVTMSTTKGDWVGIGFKTNNAGMKGADIYIGSEGKGVTDRKATGFSTPAKDAEQNVDSSACSKAGGKVTCEFRRKLVTGDSNDQPLDKEVYLLYATGKGDADSPGYHSLKGMTGNMIDVTKCVAEEAACPNYSDSKLYRVHGFLMMVSWMLLLPFGIFLGATKDAFNLRAEAKTCGGKTLQFWFVVHRPLQISGVLVMFISFIIVLVANTTTERPHMTLPHHFLGLMTIILAVLQPVLAWTRKMGNGEKQKHTIHLIWHIKHAVFGYSAQILAFATVYLGIRYVQHGSTDMESSIRGYSLAGFIIVTAAWAIFVILGVVWGMILKNNKKNEGKVKRVQVVPEGGVKIKEKEKLVSPWPMAILMTLLVIGSVLLWVDNFHPCQ